jgi:hypothetical protein
MKRNNNSKAAKYYRANKEDREDWGESMKRRCMYCLLKEGLVTGALQIHEITRRSAAPTRWADRSNYLLLCQLCHSGPFAAMEPAKELAVKMLRDPEHYDIDRWLRVQDQWLRAPLRVTQSEVDAFYKELTR